MWRLLILVSLIPPILAMAARWWYGTRVLATEGPRMCRADLARWLPQPGNGTVARRSDDTAHALGFHLWQFALAEWMERDPNAAKKRQKSKRISAIAPPFMVVIAAFALIVGKLHILGAFALVLAAVAFAAITAYLTLGGELQAVAKAAARLREAGTFRLRDDEDAVIQCAIAHTWHQALPPVLRWMLGK